MTETTTVLDRICATKRDEVARRKAATPLSALLERARAQASTRGFAAALRRDATANGVALITEIKKASPSAGLIRPDFDPAALARAYERGGSSCLSVLTDQPYFQGTEADLDAARAACALPVLRKDFMVDPYQVVEARTMGADCILLIAAALTDSEMAEMEEIASGYQMDVLVEVHDEVEMERALRLKTPLVGVNNRNLKTMKTDIATTERLAAMVPAGRMLIAESGIRDGADIARLAKAGAKGFLIGESLMRNADVERATRALFEGFAHASRGL